MGHHRPRPAAHPGLRTGQDRPEEGNRTIIEKVRIRNWQALRNVELDLGRFTVIVGPSSSGKSGLIRAFKALASNVRGTGNITRGQKSFAIVVTADDVDVALERTEAGSSYRIASKTGVDTFTKLAGGVPPQVTDALRIAPVPTGGTSLNFAGQFDKPYLLDEPGATVARELGELTNVNIIFEAVRAANKKRAMYASALRQRETDLADLTARSNTFADLPAKLAAVAAAEQHLAEAQQATDRVNRLRDLIERHHLAVRVLDQIRIPTVPDITILLDAANRRTVLRDLLQQAADAHQSIDRLTALLQEQTTHETELGGALSDLLRELGECPLCGQTTH